MGFFAEFDGRLAFDLLDRHFDRLKSHIGRIDLEGLRQFKNAFLVGADGLRTDAKFAFVDEFREQSRSLVDGRAEWQSHHWVAGQNAGAPLPVVKVGVVKRLVQPHLSDQLAAGGRDDVANQCFGLFTRAIS